LSGNGDSFPDGNKIVERTAYAFLLSEALRREAPSTLPPARPTDAAVLFTTWQGDMHHAYNALLGNLFDPGQTLMKTLFPTR